MRNFKVSNINCENCANAIKNSLKDDFGDVMVDVASGVVSLDIDDSMLSKFYEEMDDIGFEIASEVI